MKKLIISTLIPALLLSLCSCSSTKVLSKNEFIKRDSKKVSIKQYPDQKTFLVTYDNTRFQVYSLLTNIRGDTITVLDSDRLTNSGISIPFTGKIAVSEVRNFEVVEEGVGETALLVLSVTAALVLLLLALTFSPSWTLS